MKLRHDIQALRGVAVLLVVFYHLKLGPTAAGYLGVDVFFVISGYLITKLVMEGIEQKRFRLGEFYMRRAKRLLPAAYVTIFLTALCAPWFLNQQELSDFALQVFGAVTFTANIVLWQRTGYFEVASDLKPLLHMWSLAIEEQYYMLLPAVLLFLARRFWFRAVVGALVLSLGLCLVAGMFKPIATFYLLPTRAWELLIGSVGALLVTSTSGASARLSASSTVHILFYPSLLALPILGAMPIPGGHPGAGALLICLATLVVILRHHEAFEQSVITRSLSRVGDISYSLYLVHWPIIALIKNAWVGQDAELPLTIRLFALALSFVAALLLHHFVENPMRKMHISSNLRYLSKVGAASALLVAMTPLAIRASVDFTEIRRVNYGLDKACEYVTLFEPKPECRSGDNPKVLVWGDSYAMHLVPGLLSQAQVGGVVQATRSDCGPILDLGPYRVINTEVMTSNDRAWAERCIEFNRSVYDYVRQAPSVETVVLASPFVQYVNADWMQVLKSGVQWTTAPADVDASAAALHRTVLALRAAGKRVVLVAPPPASDFNVGACLERLLTGRIRFGGSEHCVIPMEKYREKRRLVIELMTAVEKLGVPVINVADALCDDRVCQTMIDGTLIYRDGGHLSYEGSKLLAQRMNWAYLIEQKAR